MTKRTKADLVHRFHRLGRDYSTATVLFHQAVASRVGLTATDVRCLDVISRSGAMTAGEIARQTGLTSGAVTTLIDRLEKRGFAERIVDPKDRRHVLVRPRPEAGQTLGPLYQSLAEAWQMVFNTIPEAELEKVLLFMRQGIELLDREREKLVRQSLK